MSTNSSLARDTQALRWSVLADEEIDAIKGVNRLIQDVKAKSACKGKRENNYPWATPEMDRYMNVIMLDGARGSGKTSLLLTMITGWQNHDRLIGDTEPDRKAVEEAFEGMNDTVCCLRPLDFDTLPPDLPLYNWIIQAFEPLVNKIGGRGGDLETWADSDTQTSLRDRFQKLQNTATVGWTTGLLKAALAKDVGDFVVWHGEQQSRWQDLGRDWLDFLDALFDHLERVDDHRVRIDKGAVIVLPIDDLDLQASRVRELLLALRVLRHERLVYLLTGYSENLRASLQVEFFRDCIRNESTMTDGLRDTVQEQSEHLAVGLFDKVVPEPHRFRLNGVPLSEILKWSPTRGKTIEAILNALCPNLPLEEHVDRILNANSRRGKNVLYRSLQGFHDRWETTNDDLKGMAQFLELLVGRLDSEEPMHVEATSARSIELSGYLSVVAPAPRDYDSVPGHGGARLLWIRELDFARRRPEQSEQSKAKVYLGGPAPPEHTLAVDFALAFPSTIRVFAGPRWADPTLGLVWSEITHPDGGDAVFLIPWRMVDEPNCPMVWSERAEAWNKQLEDVQAIRESKTVTSAVLLEAWFRFNAKPSGDIPHNKTSLNDRLAAASKSEVDVQQLARLAAGIYGLLDKERSAILRALKVTKQKTDKLEKEAKMRVYSWRPSNHDPYELAMRPSDPNARPDDKEIDMIANERPILTVLESQT